MAPVTVMWKAICLQLPTKKWLLSLLWHSERGTSRPQGWATLGVAQHCSPSSSKVAQGGFGRRESSKIWPESNAALQEIPFLLASDVQTGTAFLWLTTTTLERSLSPRDVFQQYFMSSFYCLLFKPLLNSVPFAPYSDQTNKNITSGKRLVHRQTSSSEDQTDQTVPFQVLLILVHNFHHIISHFLLLKSW